MTPATREDRDLIAEIVKRCDLGNEFRRELIRALEDAGIVESSPLETALSRYAAE